MNEPISMWSGATRVLAAAELVARRATCMTLEPMPSIAAPIFTSMRARSWTCGSQAALPITVVPGVSAAASSAFSVRHDRRLVHEDLARAQAAVGRVERDVAAVLDVGAERA